MPRYESAVAISVCLGVGVAEGGLSTEIHVTEKELAYQIRWRSGFIGFVVRFQDIHYTPVEEADTEGAEVVVGRKESS